MIANTVKDLPVTLADIKRESREDEIIESIKNKIHDKDPNVPEVFSLCDDVLLYNDRVVIPKKPTKKESSGIFTWDIRGRTARKPSCPAIYIGQTWTKGHSRHDRILRGMRACSKISNNDVQTMAQNRPSLAENTCGFCRARRQHVLPHCCR